MARERPIASSDVPPSRPDDVLRRKFKGGLSRAEQRALSRCAPLTKVEFRAQRELADQRVFPPIARLVDTPDGESAQTQE